jgi:hypothetical protein
MPEEYFDIAYINFDEAILHGRIMGGRDEQGFRREIAVRVTLDDDQMASIEALNERHRREMDRLLSGIAHAAQDEAAA